MSAASIVSPELLALIPGTWVGELDPAVVAAQERLQAEYAATQKTRKADREQRRAEKAMWPAVPTSVYLVGNTDHSVFKIGQSTNTEGRVRSLQTSCPYRLIVLREQVLPDSESATQVERALHRHFSDRRLTGEWFSDISLEELQTTIQELATQFPSELVAQ